MVTGDDQVGQDDVVVRRPADPQRLLLDAEDRGRLAVDAGPLIHHRWDRTGQLYAVLGVAQPEDDLPLDPCSPDPARVHEGSVGASQVFEYPPVLIGSQDTVPP